MVDTTGTKSSISNPLDDDSRDGAPEIEITPAMIAAGEDAIWSEIGGSDLGPAFSASALAERVYRAMRARSEART